MPDESIDWKDSILSRIKEHDGDEELQVKKLRKKVLKELSLDSSDKDGKKSFKKTMKTLEEEGVLTINAEGIVAVVETKKKRKREKKEKKEKKKKKQKKEEKEEKPEDEQEEEKEAEEEEKEETTNNNDDDDNDNTKSQKGIPCDGNPGGVTRLFLGNLPFAVDETSLGEWLPPTVTHIKWITDKETGKFYGSAFIEMDTPVAAAKATAMSSEKFMGRPIKSTLLLHDRAIFGPPAKKVISGGGTTTGGSAGGKGAKAMGEKPENCVKLFIGNLSYDIDDDTITKFFDNVGAEVKAVRWLSHRDTGDFKDADLWNSGTQMLATRQRRSMEKIF